MSERLHDEKGRFVKGHKPHPNHKGRPPNAVNKITKTLREQVMDGFGDVPTFVKNLKVDYPPAAAGLLARMMPSGDADPEAGAGTVTVHITAVEHGYYTVNMEGEELVLVSHADIRKLKGLPPLELAPPTPTVEPEPAPPAEPGPPRLIIDNDDGDYVGLPLRPGH